MSINTLLNRLPSHFNKQITSNNYKALSLVADYIDDSEALYATIQSFWDVDQAVGVGLDRLGKDEGISRGSYDDETYRKFIKIEYIINVSDGNIEVMNTILDAYLEDNFLGIDEGWNRYLGEPASVVVNVNQVYEDLPYNLLKRIKPAGVKISVATQRDIDLGLNISGAVSEYQITNILTPKFEMPDLHTSISYGALVAKYETTQIETLPFTIADAQIGMTYGGAFSNYMRTTILAKEVV